MSEKLRQIYGATNPAAPNDRAQRFASVIGLKPEMEHRYRELHANAWEPVVSHLLASNIRNYSIYLTEIENKKYLFSYFEYTGTDFEVDMQKIADHPETRRWWSETDPCQLELPDTEEGAHWRSMEAVFHIG